MSRNGRIIKEIPTVDTDGNDANITVGFSFGMNCWAEFCKIHGIGPDQLGNFDSGALQLEYIRDIIYCAAYAYCETEGKVINFTRFSVGDWIDAMEQQDLQDILGTMTNSRLLGKNLKGSVAKS